MKKRAQIAIFLVIALLIAVIAVMLLFINQEQTRSDIQPAVQQVAQVPLQAQPIKQYLESCLEQVTQEGIYTLALQGGYLDPAGELQYNEPGDGQNPFYYYFDNTRVPYVLDEQNLQLRTIDEIEAMLENYIAAEVMSCIDFSGFEQQGFSFIYDPLTVDDAVAVNVDVTESSVPVFITWPIAIQRQDQTINLEAFQTTVPLRLGLVYTTLYEVLSDIAVSSPYNIRNQCERYSAEDNFVNIYLESNPYTYQYVLRVIDAQPTQKSKLPLRFNVAIKNTEVFGECVG